MPDVYVGIGSNIDPQKHLRMAIDALQAQYGQVTCSSVYLSPAFGFIGDDFLNMVAVFATDADAEVVEGFLSSIEHAEGRERDKPRFCDRTLDLDLLLYGMCVRAGLRLPREDVLRYAFVLAPLAQIAPGLVHPVSGVRMIDAWRSFEKSCPKIEKLGALEDPIVMPPARSI